LVIQEFQMKKIVLLSFLSSIAAVCAAQETARVISSTPVISQVAVPRQVCSNQQVQVQSQKSGAGGIMGAVAGGAIGSNIGGGDGRAVATLLGILGGAMLGDRIEGGGQTQTQNVQNCSTQTFYENRTTAYNVVYEFNGKQYSVQMPQDPGPTIRLQITPVAASVPAQSAQQYAPQAQSSQTDNAGYVPLEPAQAVTQYVQPQQVIVQQAVPQVVYAAPQVVYTRPYYPPVGVNLNLGWSNVGHWHHGHGYRHGR
jgi:uncharacterized protein YcfJ